MEDSSKGTEVVIVAETMKIPLSMRFEMSLESLGYYVYKGAVRLVKPIAQKGQHVTCFVQGSVYQ